MISRLKCIPKLDNKWMLHCTHHISLGQSILFKILLPYFLFREYFHRQQGFVRFPLNQKYFTKRPSTKELMSHKLFRAYLNLLFVKFLITCFLDGTCFWGSISFLCKISRLINILSLDLCLFMSWLLLFLLLLIWRFSNLYGPFSREWLYGHAFLYILLTNDMRCIILGIFDEFRRWSVNWLASGFVWYRLLRLYLMFTISLQNLHLRGSIISQLPVVIH